MTSCDPEFYVGGDNSIDLIAWSMDVKNIFLVTEEQLNVNVFKDGQLPYTVPLSLVAPGPDDVVMYLVQGNHFDTLLPKKHYVVPDIKYKKGFAIKHEAENMTKS